MLNKVQINTKNAQMKKAQIINNTLKLKKKHSAKFKKYGTQKQFI